MDQRHQDAADRPLLGRVQAGERTLGRVRDRTPDPARVLVARDGQGGPLAPLPGGHQRVGHQRQGTGRRVPRPARRGRCPGLLAQARVPQQQGDQARLEREPGELRRARDRLAQLRHGHRGQDEQPVGEDRGQFGNVQAAAGEVGPDAEHHDGRVVRRRPRLRCGQGAQDADEAAPLVLVGAEGEKFLELVDEQYRPYGGQPVFPGFRRGVARQAVDGLEQPLRPVAQLPCGEAEIAAEHLRGAVQQFLERMGGRCEPYDRPAVGARHRESAGAPQGRYETRAEQGRFAGARPAHEHQRAAADPFEDPLDQGGGHPVAAEEPARVPRGEGGEAAVGALARRLRAGRTFAAGAPARARSRPGPGDFRLRDQP